MVNDVPPKDRDIAMVFQSYALYPHMTVRENLEFGLKIRKTPQARRWTGWSTRRREILGITELLDRKPKQLSGGQRQRVALGRAIVRKPAVFLFDEPLSNLDAKLRVQMRAEITKLQQRLKTTTVYVTHDQIEAMTMGDRIAVMNERQAPAGGHAAGGLRAARQPVRGAVHRHAADELPPGDAGRRRRGGRRAPASACRCPQALPRRRGAASDGRKVVLGIRPENIREAARRGRRRDRAHHRQGGVRRAAGPRGDRPRPGGRRPAGGQGRSAQRAPRWATTSSW